MTPVKKIMTVDPTTIDRADPLSAAMSALESAPYHHLVVTENDQPVGMLSTTDLVRLLHDMEFEIDGPLRNTIDEYYTIEDAMSVGLQSISATSSVRDAAIILSQGTFHSIVVLDEDRLAGIVTTTDLARYIVDTTEQ
ncbi:MAG: CBS domain-containing protein [Actinomycetia bacterium]|nr:CBS domain-containing protein [Actinomycetes bacterium]MCP4960003.1 CBS domain-containing protein [Actinomycetes bacterium]